MHAFTEGGPVLITGASGSLGREMALTLAAQGYRVWAGARNPERGEPLSAAAKERGLDVTLVDIDVNDPISIDAARSLMERESGALYGIVNNAAVTLRGYLEDLAEDEIEPVVEANLRGPMRVTRRALPAMREAGRGRIINVNCIGGRIGSPELSVYSSTKFGIEGFSKSLYMELKPLGIAVVLIEPGIMRTNIWQGNRKIAARAQDAASPHRDWFQRAEASADQLVRTAIVTPKDVALVVGKALRTDKPRLRYVIGWRAALVLRLRKYLPGELFERLYFGEVMRRVTGAGSGSGSGQ